MKINGVSISEGNCKAGSIPSVSLLACEACPPDAPCRAQCYVVRNMYFRAIIRNAHAANLLIARGDPVEFFTAIALYLDKRNPRFFRWHVAGDILNQKYLDRMASIADEFPDTKFLAFTKRHHLDFYGLPENLTIVRSMWPGWGDANKVESPRAWMQDGTENRVPADAIECPGNCETCGMCWELPNLKRDIVFHKH